VQRFLPVAAIGAVAAVLVAGVAWLAVDDGPVAVTVGHSTVSQATVDDELEILSEHPDFAAGLIGATFEPGPGSVPANLAASWLTFRIVTDRSEQELAHRGERITRQDIDSTGLSSATGFAQLPKEFRDRVIRRFAALRALQRLQADDPGIKDAARNACPSGRYVSHILVADQATAASLKQQIDGGADFAEVAMSSSTDPSAASGGEIGCLDDNPGLIEPFATVAAESPIGVVSDPFQTQFGWHLVLVTDSPPQQDIDAATLRAVLALAGDARVKVDPRYGTWDKRRAQVLPPVAPPE